MFVVRGSLVVMKGTGQGNLYVLLGTTVTDDATVGTNGSGDGLCESTQLWHRRLGHLNYNVLKYMLSKENVSFKYNLTFDDACHVGKFKNTTYNSSSKSLTQPLELIHSDVWGPSPILSKDGFRYYVHFVDDYNNFSRIFPLKLKYVVKHVFQNF